MIEKNSRQTFLGENLETILNETHIGVIGLGGGGSVISTQLAHIGFINFFICDPDNFEESNINRLVGAKYNDIDLNTPKIDIIQRSILSINPQANITAHKKIWQECINDPKLVNCKIIFGCLDDLINRVQIEAFCRMHKIILIDIGMTVKKDLVDNYSIMGQVVLSHPEGPCFKCYNFISNKALEKEANLYGDAGIRPQVIWPNTMLASSAIGIAIELLTSWNNRSTKAFYKRFDGNSLTLKDDIRIQENIISDKTKCEHFI